MKLTTTEKQAIRALDNLWRRGEIERGPLPVTDMDGTSFCEPEGMDYDPAQEDSGLIRIANHYGMKPESLLYWWEWSAYYETRCQWFGAPA